MGKSRLRPEWASVFQTAGLGAPLRFRLQKGATHASHGLVREGQPRAGGSAQRARLLPAASTRVVLIHRLGFVSVAAYEIEQSAVADQVQGADDDEVVLVAMEELLDLRYPALVPIRHEEAVQRGKRFVFVAQERGEFCRIARTPRRYDRLGFTFDVVHLGDDHVEEAGLIRI